MYKQLKKQIADIFKTLYEAHNEIENLFAKQDFDNAFKKADVLLSPTCPFTAFKLGEKVSDPLSMYLTDIGTITANLAGLPAMSIPVGLDTTGMPIGLQLLANNFNETKLLNVAHMLEGVVKFDYSKGSLIKA